MSKVDFVGTSILVITGLAIVVASWFTLDTYTVWDYKVVLISPTEEQVLDLYKRTSEEGRFWIREVHAVKGENSLPETTIGVRMKEGEGKISSELDKLNFEYYIVGKVGRK